MGLVDKIPLRTFLSFLHTGFFATETGTQMSSSTTTVIGEVPFVS